MLGQIGHRGAGFSLVDATSLRLDFGELESIGFTSVRFDASRFLRDPLEFTDFHTGDIAPYVRRYNVDLVATGIVDEPQLLGFLEDDIVIVQGPHITAPGPVGTDLLVERPVPPVAPYRAPPP